MLAHIAVDALYTARCQQCMQRRNVGKAYEPLRVALQRQLRKAVEQVHGSVAATRAENGTHGGVGVALGPDDGDNATMLAMLRGYRPVYNFEADTLNRCGSALSLGL